MFLEWSRLSEDQQIELSREALCLAAANVASQAEVLADEIESGNLADRGGPDALRLFAAVVRGGCHDAFVPVGHA